MRFCRAPRSIKAAHHRVTLSNNISIYWLLDAASAALSEAIHSGSISEPTTPLKVDMLPRKSYIALDITGLPTVPSVLLLSCTALAQAILNSQPVIVIAAVLR